MIVTIHSPMRPLARGSQTPLLLCLVAVVGLSSAAPASAGDDTQIEIKGFTMNTSPIRVLGEGGESCFVKPVKSEGGFKLRATCGEKPKNKKKWKAHEAKPFYATWPGGDEKSGKILLHVGDATYACPKGFVKLGRAIPLPICPDIEMVDTGGPQGSNERACRSPH